MYFFFPEEAFLSRGRIANYTYSQVKLRSVTFTYLYCEQAITQERMPGHCQHTVVERCRLDAATTRKQAITGKNQGKRDKPKKIEASNQ